MQVLLNVLADEIHRAHQRCTTAEGCDPNMCKRDLVFQAGAASMQLLQGAYSCICLIGGVGLVAFRDPYGIRWGLASYNTGLGSSFLFSHTRVSSIGICTDAQPCAQGKAGWARHIEAMGLADQGPPWQHIGTTSSCMPALERLLPGSHLPLWAGPLPCSDLLFWVDLREDLQCSHVRRGQVASQLQPVTGFCRVCPSPAAKPQSCCSEVGHRQLSQSQSGMPKAAPLCSPHVCLNKADGQLSITWAAVRC